MPCSRFGESRQKLRGFVYLCRMKTVQIQANDFFELLKSRDTSMWSVFAQMIDGEAKELVFLNENKQVLFSYQLPTTKEQLDLDQKQFAQEYAKKLSERN